jgi:zinc transport system substrate-binding protein
MTTLFKLLIAAMLLLGSTVVSAADKLTVYTVNYPLAYFAERIGGEHIQVVFPVPSDVDPAFWEPDAVDIAKFQQADLILLNGADYAGWVKRASLPRRKLVNTSAAFQKEYISVKATATHQHGPGGEHSHTGTAFTTWLDFKQAIQQARAVLNALERFYPDQRAEFRRKFLVLETELVCLDNDIQALVARAPNELFIASHPVYQYLARRYNIQLQSVMWEPDVIPDKRQWSQLSQLLRNHPAKWMIWEGEPDEQSVTRLRKKGIKSLIFAPCANTPEQGDFMSVMEANVKQLERAYLPGK